MEYVGEIVGGHMDANGNFESKVQAGPAYADPHTAEMLAYTVNGGGSPIHGESAKQRKKFREGYDAIFGLKEGEQN